MERDQNFQKISWFWDLRLREILDLDPPYQRRSVWNQDYRDYFIDTILLNYPAPAIFLYEETAPSGQANYHVVDGKQRLTTIFDFLEGEFPVSEKAQRENLRGLSFNDLSDEEKRKFFSYKFSVEYIPNADESIINAIFDRINRNVAKLSPQELRHAKYDGALITKTEELTEFLSEQFPADFPRIAPSSKKHMKDVEFVAELLLYLELGPKNHSQADLDEAFNQRDEAWEGQEAIERLFRETIATIKSIITAKPNSDLPKSRIRNQADFYSLFATIERLTRDAKMPSAGNAALRLRAFLDTVEDEPLRMKNKDARDYYDAARSSSNDLGQRTKRIDILTRVITTPTATKKPALSNVISPPKKTRRPRLTK